MPFVFLLFPSYFLRGKLVGWERVKSWKVYPSAQYPTLRTDGILSLWVTELGKRPKTWEIFPNTCCTVRSVHPQSKTNLLSRDAPEKAAVGGGLQGRKDLSGQNCP